jgi:branched-chain amino acid transport system permease protein
VTALTRPSRGPAAEEPRLGSALDRLGARQPASRIAAALAVIVLAAAVPGLGASQYLVSIFMQAEVLMCLALGLNIVVGYAGLLDLGFAAFFAIGAYSTGLLTTKLHWPVLASLPVGVVLALIGAVIVGLPTLRLRSDYLAIVTLGFGEIIETIANNLNVTGGPTGIFGIPPLTVGGLQITTTTGYYWVFLVMLVIFVGVVLRLRRSRLGRAWLCIREDEDAAQAMGIKTQRYKLYSYMGGAVIGALTGSMYAPALTAIAPPSFGFNESLLILMAVAIGGMGSVWGALLGGAIVELVPELLRAFSQARLLVFGVILVVMMMVRPQGLWPEGGFGLGDLVRRTLGRGGAGQATGSASPTFIAGGGAAGVAVGGGGGEGRPRLDPPAGV